MKPPDEIWRIDFAITFPKDGTTVDRCECFATRAERDARAERLVRDEKRHDVFLSRYKKVAEQ